MPLISFHTPPATAFFRVHEPKIFGEDISARRKTVVGVEHVRKADCRCRSRTGFAGRFRHDADHARRKERRRRRCRRFLWQAIRRQRQAALRRRSGRTSLRRQGLANIASTFGDSSLATQEELKSAFDGGSLRRDATLNGHPAALYLGQIRNYAGQPVAVIELVKDTAEYEAAATSSQRTLILGTIAILVGAVLLALLLGRGLSRPLAAITAVMNRLSSGDTDVTIPGGERKDELGTMAVAVDVFRRNMIEARTLRETQDVAEQQAELEKKALQRQMADRFESRRQERGRRGRASHERTCNVSPARSPPASAARRSRPPQRLEASEEASASVDTVAAATEQLASSVAEIGRQVTYSSDVADAAVAKAGQTTEMVAGLPPPAKKSATCSA